MYGLTDARLTSSGPVLGSAPGWPLVLYFHHVTPAWSHYTALSPAFFRLAVETVLEHYGPPVDPRRVAAVGPEYGTEPSFLLTFDDGYLDNLDYAVPVLRDYGVRAVFFAVTGEIDEAGAIPPDARRAQPTARLTWTELDGLRAEGHVVANHTVSHRRLPDCTPEEQLAEVRDAELAIARRMGEVSGLVAYPYGEPPTVPVLGDHQLGFATVRVPPRPWCDDASAAPHAIRRTYLPTAAPEQWPALCAGWRSQWYG